MNEYYKQQTLFPDPKTQRKKKRLFIHEGSYPTEYDPNVWPYKPNMIQIETVQGCNRRCDFCGTMGIERTFHFAEIETIDKISRMIAEAKLNSRILLAGHGEPCLHKNLPEIIRTIRKNLPNNMIHLFTNGIVIAKNPALTDLLFDAGLNDLIFDEYNDSRIGEFVRDDEICKKYTIVEQSPGVPLFEDKNVNLKRICITPPIENDHNTINRKIENHCGAGNPGLESPLKQTCSIIFRDFYIRWDGKVSICCNDFRGEYFVVDMKECKTFAEAWFHERLEAARRFLMAKDRSAIFPCSICDSKPIRPGLLPDFKGDLVLPEPSERDHRIVSKKFAPLSKIVRRDYEKGKEKGMRYLIVAAHPDDEAIAAGAAICKWKEIGNTVGALILSSYSATREDNLIEKERLSREILDLDYLQVCDYETMKFGTYDRYEMVKKIEEAIKVFSPDILITHFPGDLHNDHKVTASLVHEAARLPQRMLPEYQKRLKAVWYMETLSSTDWNFGERFTPNTFVPVEEKHIQKQIESIALYDNVLRDIPHPRNYESVKALARYRGGECGTDYAVAFHCVFQIEGE